MHTPSKLTNYDEDGLPNLMFIKLKDGTEKVGFYHQGKFMHKGEELKDVIDWRYACTTTD